MMKNLKRQIILLGFMIFWLLAGGCSTLNTAKPLSPGEHEVAFTMGGPLTNVRGNYIPLPNSVIEGRSGLIEVGKKPLDINYGLYLTPMAFGQMGMHVGGSYLLWEQELWLPAFSISDRLFFFHNYFDLAKPITGRGISLVHQLEGTLSYEISDFLVYFGLSNHSDLTDLEIMLSPFLGAELPVGLKGLKLQLEARHFAVNKQRLVESVKFYNFDSDYGAFGMNLGFIWEIGQ